jgi:hypothetical protein
MDGKEKTSNRKEKAQTKSQKNNNNKKNKKKTKKKTQTNSSAYECDRLRSLDLLDVAAFLKRPVAARIANLEAERAGDDDLPLGAIQLSHALHLLDLDHVTVLQIVALGVHYSDNTLLRLHVRSEKKITIKIETKKK